MVALIGASAVAAVIVSLRDLADPEPVDHLAAVCAAALVGFVGNEWVARYRIQVGRRIGSAALVADRRGPALQGRVRGRSPGQGLRSRHRRRLYRGHLPTRSTRRATRPLHHRPSPRPGRRTPRPDRRPERGQRVPPAHLHHHRLRSRPGLRRHLVRRSAITTGQLIGHGWENVGRDTGPSAPGVALCRALTGRRRPRGIPIGSSRNTDVGGPGRTLRASAAGLPVGRRTRTRSTRRSAERKALRPVPRDAPNRWEFRVASGHTGRGASRPRCRARPRIPVRRAR